MPATRPARIASGPSSRTRAAPSSATVPAKSTVVRICETQYSGSSHCPAVATVTRGGWNVNVRTTVINREWNAWLVRRRVVFQPCDSTPSTSDSRPATTTEEGPLTAAMSSDGNAARTSSAGA